MSGSVLVTAATGNVGRPTVEALVAAGAHVRAGVRDPDAATEALPAGVETVRLDFQEPATFSAAVEGVVSLFLLRPPAIARVRGTLNRLVDAAVEAGVAHCVFCSVEGADRNRLIPHHAVEEHLRASGLSWTFLRPGFFAQNLTGPYLGDIRRGRLVLPAGDAPVAFVDTRDVGEVAASILRAPEGHAGEAYVLTGREAIGFGDVARLLSGELNRNVEYEPVGLLRYARHLRRHEHASLVRIGVLTALHANVRRGGSSTVDPGLERLLGRPARAVADLIRDERELLAG